MPENNQQRNNPHRRPPQGAPNGQRRQGQQGQGSRRPPQNRQGQQSRQGQQRRSRREQERAAAISSAVKGIIAIMLTFLIVIVVIMLFWKNLFTGTDTGPKATGSITSTTYIPPETKTATEKPATKRSSKKKEEKEEEEEDEGTQTIRCTGAVLLHPEPSSSSATLATIPAGVDVKFYRNENNWFYVEYNGQQGYAWGNYFTAPTESTAN